MKILPVALDRIRASKLSPEHLIQGFGALEAIVNHTGSTAAVLPIDFALEGETIGPDELVPVITLSFKPKVTHEEAGKESTTQVNPQVTAQAETREPA